MKHDKRKEYGYFLQPDYERHISVLQRQFDEHLKLVHPDESATKPQK